MTKPDSYRWLIAGGYDSRREWKFPLTLDGTSPAVAAVRDEETGEILLTVTEEQFLAYAVVQDSTGEVLLAETYEGETRGESYTLPITLPEGETALVLYITLGDYASNHIGYRIDFSISEEASRCAMAFFADVRKEAWYHEAVDFVYERGLMDTLDMGNFAPDKGAMRATVVEVLYRLAGKPSVEKGELPFTDLQGNEGYLDAVKWAYQAGVVNGYSDTLFGALAPIPRQQLATMLYRAAKLGGEVAVYDESLLDNFVDGTEVAGWAREAMIWAVGEGIFTGDDGGKLSPRTVTTRAELAQIIMNIQNES